MGWKTISKKLVDENPFWQHWQNDFVTPLGHEGKYHYHKNENAVSTFARLEGDKFAMIKEHRYLFDKSSVSQTQGSREPGEKPEDAARRELMEEMGYMAGKFTHLGRHATAPAFSTEEVDIYLAENLKPVGQKLDVVEEIEVIEMTAAEIDAAIKTGEIWDNNVIGPWMVVKLHLGL